LQIGQEARSTDQSPLSAGGFLALGFGAALEVADFAEAGIRAALGFAVSPAVAALVLTFFLTTLGFFTAGAASAEGAAAPAGLARVLTVAADESDAAFSATTRGFRGARGFFAAGVSVELADAEALTGGEATFAAGAGVDAGEDELAGADAGADAAVGEGAEVVCTLPAFVIGGFCVFEDCGA
jgi:hypothetical protein